MINRPMRAATAAASLVLCAGSATAAFLGIELREDKNLAVTHPATGLPGFPATNPRVFNLYAKFDGQSSIDTVLSIGQPDTIVGIGVDLSLNPGANFYQAPGAAGAALVGGINEDGAGDNRRYWNTFVSIGVKTYNGDYGPVYSDTTSSDPDFGMRNRDGVGTPALQANDFLAGGWFNASPPNSQGAAVAGPNGFETFIGQFSLIGLNPNSEAWIGRGPAPSAATFWYSGVLSGQLTIFRQGGPGEPSAVGHTVLFVIPSPGALLSFALAGAGLARRRRRN